MALWDASADWATLVIRAPTQDAARKIAVDLIEEEVGPDFDLSFVGEDWPRRLSPDGPSEILVEDFS